MGRLVPLAVVALLACNQKDTSGVGTTTTTKGDVPTAAEKGGSMLTGDEVSTITKAMQDGMLAVDLAHGGEARATKPEVKALAATVHRDQMAANDALREIVAKKRAVIPTKLDDEHTRPLGHLEGKQGGDFDEQLVEELVRDSQHLQSTLRDARDVKDGELRSWIDATLPRVDEHLARARALDH